ncbi:FHA domain-containing protein [Cohnella zeiphila]|uniref:FHA domain-containing protein n=1 Tax=Cohnella zeiphila TaxID=2761120 RepID=A0A7X0SHK8_9BACL|nr:FHA domain-containing protein [Cohnella zeiphila]MBB6730107.1 FHA domain-containing protein [Cohnella zeiphila]
MSTVDDRPKRGGQRTLAASGRPATTRMPRMARRSGLIRAVGLCAGAIFWLVGAAPAGAADWTSRRAAQREVDTLPLLAAMGIGVAIAVFAVIAFLQMTRKARRAGVQGEEEREDERSAEAEERLPEEDDGRKPESGEEESDSSGVTDPDYTIPLPVAQEPPEAAAPARAGMPSVWGVEGEFTGSGFLVSNRWLTMGRDASQCGVIFRGAAGEISRKHCSLRFEESRGLFLLEDHASSNGTFLSGGERLLPGVIYELPPGERFALSGSKHWFEVQI